MTLEDLLTGLQRSGGSDLYLTADAQALYRVDGSTIPATDAPLDAAQVEAILRPVLEQVQAEPPHTRHGARGVQLARFLELARLLLVQHRA